jgi:hypothetical protein
LDTDRLDRYAAQGKDLREIIEGLDSADLLWSPPGNTNAGAWTIQQVVMHLMDSDLIWTARMKQIIAEDNPQIVPYDESRFAARLFYERQSAADAVTIFELNRRNFGRLLLALPESAWERTGWHPERGKISLADCVVILEGHLDHHAAFIRKKRALLGK